MLSNYLKIAWRNLLRNKVYSLINITGLALGLAACLAIGLYVQDELSYDRFHHNFDEIYRVVETQKQADGLHSVAFTPGPLAPSLEGDFPEIIGSTRVASGDIFCKAKKRVSKQSRCSSWIRHFSSYSISKSCGETPSDF